MKRTENECVGCTELGIPCMGSSCPNRHVTRWYCDMCGDESDVLYDYDDKELCEYCVLKVLPKVDMDE